MNCLECQENLVACVEQALDPQTAAACQRHLADCPSCRQQYDAIARVQRQLVTHGDAAASVSLAGPVMSRIRAAQPAALPGRRSPNRIRRLPWCGQTVESKDQIPDALRGRFKR